MTKVAVQKNELRCCTLHISIVKSPFQRHRMLADLWQQLCDGSVSTLSPHFMRIEMWKPPITIYRRFVSCREHT